MTTLIVDTETSGFLDKPDLKLWMLQVGDADTDEVQIYGQGFDLRMGDEILQRPILGMAEGLDRIAKADKVVFQNGIGFDWEVFEKFYPGFLRKEQLLDTLVMARLAYPGERNHSLRSWGERLGVPKDSYQGDYQSVTEDFLLYSAQDIHAGRKLFRHVKHVLDWGRSCQLEHDVQWALIAQERNGFKFNVKAAEAMVITLRVRQTELEVSLQETFPPIDRTTFIIPKVNNAARGYVKGERCIQKQWLEPFNPGSRAHIAERLQMVGWKPTEFGAAGGATVDEKTLLSLSTRFPEATLMLEYFKVSKTLGALSDGNNGYLRLVKSDGAVHGRVNGNGARTGRMSHSKPNTANVDKDKAIRSLFEARPGMKLVGCDGEGIQLRILAHYLNRYDGGAMADRIVNGKKSEGTDPHSVNRDALRHLGLTDREGAKTLIYAKLFGSTAGGLAHTLKDALNTQGGKPPRMAHFALGEAVNKALSVGMVGLDRLEKRAQEELAAKGYLIGLDGRRIFSDFPRLALVSLCQGGEAVVMKLALAIFWGWHGKSHGITWGLCANVHDEVQFEALIELAESMGKEFAECITQAGIDLRVKCHMAGAYQVGNNWSETH